MLFTIGQKTRVAVLPTSSAPDASGDGEQEQEIQADSNPMILAHHLRAEHGAELENIKFGFVSTTDMMRWKALDENAAFRDESGVGIKRGGERKYMITF